MWMLQVPTAEDIRDFQFPSLDQSSQEQRQAIGNMVQAMDMDQFNLNQIYNPVLQNLYQVLAQKAIQPN